MSLVSSRLRGNGWSLPDAPVAKALIVLLLGFFMVALALPLWGLLSKSAQDASGKFVGLANYAVYFSTPALFESAINSALIGVVVTLIVVPLAFVYAFALTRSTIRLKPVLYAAALLPLFAPSMLSALSLVYVFGNQGFLKEFLPAESIYGPFGIVLAQIFFCFPHALLILVTSLSLADRRLYEAAQALGASRWRMFRTVTLPSARYGLVLATLVIFTLSVTDFGIAKVLGGQFSVLATDAYKQVVGLQNFEMGAVVGVLLLTPALISFIVQHVAQRKQAASLTARAVPLVPKPRLSRDLTLTFYCIFVGGSIVGLFAVSVWASFITFWPYNLSLTLAHYEFARVDPSGWRSYFTSLELALATSVIGTIVVFLGAYLIEKHKVVPVARQVAQFFALVPMAVPGLVLGLSYVFFFNAPWNPLNFLYGTLALMVLNTVAHFYTTAHVTATTALKQIDREFENVSESLRVPFWRTLWRVTIPISSASILDIAVYMFVNALTTVSALIFLYRADNKVASIAMIHMDEAGQIASAAGMAACIMLTAIGVRVLHGAVAHFWARRADAWRAK